MVEPVNQGVNLLRRKRGEGIFPEDITVLAHPVAYRMHCALRRAGQRRPVDISHRPERHGVADIDLGMCKIGGNAREHKQEKDFWQKFHKKCDKIITGFYDKITKKCRLFITIRVKGLEKKVVGYIAKTEY